MLKIEPENIDNNIDNTLIQKLINKVSGKCIEDGLVKEGSIKILNRDNGTIRLSDLNGNIYFNIQYTASFCNPFQNQQIECIVLEINKTTVVAYIEDKDKSPLNIFLTKQHHMNDEKYVNLKINDTIIIDVLFKKYEFNDDQIIVFGKLN